MVRTRPPKHAPYGKGTGAAAVVWFLVGYSERFTSSLLCSVTELTSSLLPQFFNTDSLEDGENTECGGGSNDEDDGGGGGKYEQSVATSRCYLHRHNSPHFSSSEATDQLMNTG